MALNIALSMAAGTAQAAASPAPSAGWSGWSISAMTIVSGTSANVKIGYDAQSTDVTPRRSHRTCSFSVRLML